MLGDDTYHYQYLNQMGQYHEGCGADPISVSGFNPNFLISFYRFDFAVVVCLAIVLATYAKSLVPERMVRG